MSKKLAGTLFVRNGIQYDYCFLESIKCLTEFCDHTFIVDAGSDDGTYEAIVEISGGDVTVIPCDKSEWENQKGREKLNYFTNIAINAAHENGYGYQFNLQADEILNEKSYDSVRKAIEEGIESFVCRRINLWRSPYLQLNVPHNRMPCNENIVRLAKTNCRSYGDAESIASNSVSQKYLNDIRIYHMGFVRKREMMKSKIINMQTGVFALKEYDPKLDQSETFNPDLWFDPKEDLRPIDEPLPVIIQDWAKERLYDD